jgi:hypothetical protein
MSVPLVYSPDRSDVAPGSAVRLFQTSLTDNLGSGGQQYDVSADGERFLMLSVPGSLPPITLIQNWSPENE